VVSVIDLHTHSTASDGTDTPAELVANAVAAGVRTLAVTDHDTTGGWDEAAAAVQRLPVPFTLVRGTEFSCVHPGPDGRPLSLHLLGYLYDPESPELKAERARLRESRLGRGEAIVESLARAGYPVNWQQVVGIARGGSVGRPHIGQALVEAGVVTSVNEAFAELLSNSSPHYVPKRDMPVLLAIALIRQAGGVPVIAHPWARRRGRVLDEAGLAELVTAGLLGIEVDHVDHDPADRIRLRELAAEFGTLTTGSSDYHGTHKTVRLAAEATHPDEFERMVDSSSGVGLVTSGV
jgi:predicted metal-dependent phosphoesterase TrpH